MAGAQQPRQLRVRGAATVEVGAHGDDHQRTPARVSHRGHERVDERRALRLVAAGREHLLELVDRHDQPAVVGQRRERLLERAQRMLPGTQHGERPRLAPGQHARGERSEQTGMQCRGLPAAGGPDDPQERGARHRATSSATNRSRPKKKPASPASNEASPLYGQAATSGAGRARRLELDDAADEVVLGGAQPGSLARRAPGRRVESAGGVGARPVGDGAPAPRAPRPGPGSPPAGAAAPARARRPPVDQCVTGVLVGGRARRPGGRSGRARACAGREALAQRLLRDERVDLAEDSRWRPAARSASIASSSAAAAVPRAGGSRRPRTARRRRRRAASRARARAPRASAPWRDATARSGRRPHLRARAAAHTRGRA